MQMMLQLSGFLRANSAQSAAKLLERLGSSLGLDLETFAAERYWKDPALMRFHGEILLDELPARDAFFETVSRFAKLSSRVSVTPPRESLEWDFTGEVDHTAIPGVEVVTFTMNSNHRAER